MKPKIEKIIKSRKSGKNETQICLSRKTKEWR